MPNYKNKTFYFWSDEEKEAHNSFRHKEFVEELYRFAHLPKKEFEIILAEFKKRRRDLID